MGTERRAQFWRDHVDSWRSSGLTQQQYGRKHGVRPATLAQWSSLLKREAASKSRGLVPVRVTGQASSSAHARSEATGLVMQLQRGDWRIVVPVGADVQWLAAVLREVVAC
jgi:hypothetical protein